MLQVVFQTQFIAHSGHLVPLPFFCVPPVNAARSEFTRPAKFCTEAFNHLAMSLGFNNNVRQPRITNLGGAVGASTLLVTQTRRRRSNAVRSPQTALAPSPVPVRAPVAVRPAVTPGLPAPVEKIGHDHYHWVYATAVGPVLDAHTEEVVADAGARIMLVYPMESDASTGKVRMQMRSSHATTGPLTDRWVVVHDPDADGRVMADFSVVP